MKERMNGYDAIWKLCEKKYDRTPWIDASELKGCWCVPNFKPEVKQEVNKLFLHPDIPTMDEVLKDIYIVSNKDPANLNTRFTVGYHDHVIDRVETSFEMAAFELTSDIGENMLNTALSVAREEVAQKVQKIYEKKIKEETNMIKNIVYIPGMNEQENRSLMKVLDSICYDLEAEYDYGPGGKACGVLKITIPFDKVPMLKVSTPAIGASINKKNGWIEGLPAIQKIETYNNRVVKVTFIDGTFTKAVCSENDPFDLDVGITICAMKRIFGENGTRDYNNFIRHAHEVMVENRRAKLAEAEKKETAKKKKRKAELKKAAKKLKAKEESIDIQKQAIIRAHQEIERAELEDDLK